MNIITKQKAELLIVQNKILTFDYVAKDLEVTRERKVLPIKILFDKLGEPDAVQGFDFEKMAIRAFKIEGIQKLEMIPVGEAFDKYKIAYAQNSK